MVESLFESSSIIKHQASASINQEMIPQYYFNKSVNIKIFSFVLIIWEILEPRMLIQLDKLAKFRSSVRLYVRYSPPTQWKLRTPRSISMIDLVKLMMLACTE